MGWRKKIASAVFFLLWGCGYEVYSWYVFLVNKLKLKNNSTYWQVKYFDKIFVKLVYNNKGYSFVVR